MALSTPLKRDCDLCKAFFNKKEPALYDGKTLQGPWAYMCEACYRVHGSPWPKPTVLNPKPPSDA